MKLEHRKKLSNKSLAIMSETGKDKQHILLKSHALINGFISTTNTFSLH